MEERGYEPSELVGGVGEGLSDLALGGLGGVGDDALLSLGVQIFAAGVRHVEGWLEGFLVGGLVG
jgi:hypothetical protein